MSGGKNIRRQKNDKVVLLFMNLNRVGQLALKNEENKDIITNHMSNVMGNIWNTFTTKELCQELNSPEHIMFFRKFLELKNT